jgi:PAS domain S-box-containing protein
VKDVSQQLIQDRIRDLRENTDFVSTLFESLIGYAIIAADFDGNIIAYNEGAHQIYGYASEEIIGQQNMEIFFPKDFVEAGKLQQVIDDLMGKGRVSFEGEKVRKGGERFPAQVLFTLTKDRGGRVVGFVEIVGDLTERKRAEEAEAQARASAERIEQLERELRSLEQLSAPPSTAVTAQLYDAVPLRESVPDTFNELVQRYGELMNLTLEQRAHKAEHDISGELRSIGERLGLLRAGPRDVVEIHSNALKGKTSVVTPQRAQGYVEEGRLMVLELMGYLAAFYRTCAAGDKRET